MLTYMRLIISILIVILAINSGLCQSLDYEGSKLNTITTAVPFLLLNPNAQTMGMGGIGVVSSGNYENGLVQNPALLSRNETVFGMFYTYNPWLNNLIDGIFLEERGFYCAITKRIAIGYRYRKFTLGEINFTDVFGNVTGSYKPKEYTMGYRMAFGITKKLSVGIGLNYIFSDLTGGAYVQGQESFPGISYSTDFGIDYRSKKLLRNGDHFYYDMGLSVLNIGNKIYYTSNKDGDFIPTILKVGVLLSYEHNIDENYKYSFGIAYQAEKLLVPTPPIYEWYEGPNSVEHILVAGMDPNVSVWQGMLQSFYDAPGGTKEELREIVHVIGIENRLTIKNDLQLAWRFGHLNEHKYKGNRKYFNFGFGIQYKYYFFDYATIMVYRWGTEYIRSTFNEALSHNYTFGVRLKV